MSNIQDNDIQQQLTDLNNQIYFELVSRLILLSLSIVFLLIFILASLKPLGNYSNDGIKFGRDFFFEKLMHNHISQISISHTSLDTDRILYKKNCWFKFTSFLELLWRHFLPIGHVSHLISILMLLFSRIVFTNSTTNSFDKIMSNLCLFFRLKTRLSIYFSHLLTIIFLTFKIALSYNKTQS